MSDRGGSLVMGPVVAALAILCAGAYLFFAASEAPSLSDDEYASAAQSTSSKPRRPRSAPVEAELRGVILDIEGTPIRGARVCLIDQRHGLGLAAVEGSAKRCTQSDAVGGFELGSIAPGNYELGATAVGFRPGPGDEQRALQIAPGQRIENRKIALLEGGVLVRGRVVDLRGGPVEGAWVMSGSDYWTAGSPFSDRSDAEGKFDLWVHPGESNLVARAEGYAAGSAKVRAPTSFAEIRMAPESVIEGQVIEAKSGEALAGVLISAGPQARAIGLGPPQEVLAYSDQDGRFALRGLLPGRYAPVVQEQGYRGVVSPSIVLGLAAHREVSMEVETVSSLSGRVIEQGSGRPAARQWFNLWPENEEETGARPGRQSSVTDKVGAFSLTLEPGMYSLELENEKLGPFKLERGERRDLGELTVPAKTRISGRVTDPTGAPLGGVGITVRRDKSTSSTTSSADGSYSLTVSAGPARIEVEGRCCIESKNEEHELGSGAQTLHFTLETGASIHGRIVNKQGKALAGLRVEAQGSKLIPAAESNDDGSFVIPGLKPGSYRLRILDMYGEVRTLVDPRTSKVGLAAGESTKLELRVQTNEGHIEGRVLDSSGQPVADVLVAARREPPDSPVGTSQLIHGTGIATRGTFEAFTDSDGRFRLKGLGPGDYALRAWRPDGAGESVLNGVELGSEVEMILASLLE